ncbi:MAG: bacteriohemerythrin [Magnetococcales bacterium]|nr:bacteriohemerythrin [Magnetococcales bacterium]
MEITTTDLVAFLGKVPGFKDLPETDVKQKILPIVGISQFEPGQTIIKHGDTPHTLFIIYQGRVHGLAITQDGKEHHFFIHEGNVFGEFALVSNQRRNSTIVAGAPTICLTLDIDTFQQIMMRDARFTKAFFILIGQRIIERTSKLEVTKYKWSDKYKIGVPEVDDQHKRLFDAINELGTFLENSTDEEDQHIKIQNFLIEITNYTEKHFRDEERLMEKTEAPWLAEHKQVHQALLANVVSFREKIVLLSHKDEQLHIMQQVHKFMGNWLIEHILQEDLSFGVYFKEQESRQPQS